MQRDVLKDNELKLLLLRYGLTFKKLLEENELVKTEGNKVKPSLVTSLGQLSSATGLRKATLSEIFRGNSNPRAATIYTILNALDKSFTDFSKYFDNFKDKEV